MFPSLDLNNATTKIEEETAETSTNGIGRCFLFDFQNGDFVLRDGKLVVVEDIDALKVWIEKILRTEKFKFKIYEKENKEDEYGISIKKLLAGKKYPKGFVESEIKREITNALIKHVEIDSISSFATNIEGIRINISFRVNLKDNRSFEQEVSFLDGN
ncbi:DUF2634 domain-containing protein [Tepidibacter mesophilus]|uniref:DUF2634 domain-containing protein n=1 Tax=Tepidibacter mesophilus TaxID=655607 RepID=UPI000C069116|nr:DUF2634 domain-containing protein [Tepidibacter mesophilus]